MNDQHMNSSSVFKMSKSGSGSDSESDNKAKAKSVKEPTLVDLMGKLCLGEQDIKVLRDNNCGNGCDVSTMTWEDIKSLMQARASWLASFFGGNSIARMMTMLSSKMHLQN